MCQTRQSECIIIFVIYFIYIGSLFSPFHRLHSTSLSIFGITGYTAMSMKLRPHTQDSTCSYLQIYERKALARNQFNRPCLLIYYCRLRTKPSHFFPQFYVGRRHIVSQMVSNSYTVVIPVFRWGFMSSEFVVWYRGCWALTLMYNKRGFLGFSHQKYQNTILDYCFRPFVEKK